MSIRQAAQQRFGLRNIGLRTLPKISAGTFLLRGVQTSEMIFN